MNYRHIVSLSSFTLIWGIVWYFFHPLMVRLLSDTQFVELEFLMSMMGIMGTIFGGIGLFINKELASIGNDQVRQYTFLTVFVKAYLKLIPRILVLLLILGALIWRYFHASSYLLIMYNMILILLWWITSVVDGTCKARHYYTLVNFNTIMWHVLKILIWGWLAYLWAWVWWATTGLVLWWLILFVINVSIVYRRYRGFIFDDEYARQIYADFTDIRGQLIANTFLVIILAIMFNMDIMIAAKILNHDQAAIYSALSVIAKFIFFVCGSIEIVSYTHLVAHHIYSRYDYIKPLWWYILALVWGMIGIWFFGTVVLDVFKPWLSMYMSLFTSLFIYYLIFAIISLYSKLLLAYGVKYILVYLTIVIIIMWYILETSVHDIASIVSVLVWWWVIALSGIRVMFAVHYHNRRLT